MSTQKICNNDFIMQLGGKDLDMGLFNSFSKDNVKKWTEIVSEAYPEFQNLFKFLVMIGLDVVLELI